MRSKAYNLLLILNILILTGCSGDSSPTGGNGNGNGNGQGPPPPAPVWEAFQLADLLAEYQTSAQLVLTFLDKSSLSMSLYVLDVDEVDTRATPTLDETYYIAQGNAKLSEGSHTEDVTPGMVFYFGANVDRNFHSITEELQVLIVTSKTQPIPGGLQFQSFTRDNIVAARNNTSNIWNPFLSQSSLIFGMYMLPQIVGGDATLVHTWDEINIVVNGSSRFQMGSDTIDIKPGSIVYVKDNVGHRFHTLNENIDILIWWEVRR